MGFPEPPWCNVNYGPQFQTKAFLAYNCRLSPGHTGPHECPAANRDEWVDTSRREELRSEARKVAGR